eukprot:615570-Heterocapsa_arctica.AAC.1
MATDHDIRMIHLHAMIYNPQTDMRQEAFNTLCNAEEHTETNTDVHTASFPCQPFSTLNRKHQGQTVWEDHRTEPLLRMIIIWSVAQPKSIILENVPNFQQIKDGTPFNHIIHALTII